MNIPPVNYLAILVAAIVIFLLGGLWYSPVLFAKKWIALQGRTEEQMRARTGISAVHGALFGFMCWLGFAATTSYATALFSGKPRQLWLIDSTYNLVSFALAGIILAVWR